MTGTDRAARRWVLADIDAALAAIAADVGPDYLADERATVAFLLEQAQLPAAQTAAVAERARQLAAAIRTRQQRSGGLDALLGEYDLASSEGIVLMCLAEALLRIPDRATADRLIADKLGTADWQAHVGTSDSLFVNAATWGLMLTGKLVRPQAIAQPPGAFLTRLIARVGEPVVRTALRQAMKILGSQFVMGETIDAALERAAHATQFSYSFDMLGEAALTQSDAARYFDDYSNAIAAVGAAKSAWGDDLADLPSVSVKLSALCPRYDLAHANRALPELSDRLTALALAADRSGIGLTVDAEEADRLELSLAIFERAFRDPRLKTYPSLGLAVQAYQKRAWRVVSWLEELAHGGRKVIPVRLVKGAYWDAEIKRAQEQGLAGYPVFTRKSHTDVSYLACAKELLTASPHLYPQFATHNAHTVAWLLDVGARRRFEFQRLHGMGEELYAELIEAHVDRRCRVYAPVGSHAHLLPYLVRRLLENGANTSFVNRLARGDAAFEAAVADPAAVSAGLDATPHPRIPLPRDLYAPERRNSRGANLADLHELRELEAALRTTTAGSWHAAPRVAGAEHDGAERTVLDPADQRREVGAVRDATADTALAALAAAHDFQPEWNAVPAIERADALRRAADLYEDSAADLVARCVAETGRTIPDSLAEVREAVDLLRYYAAEAERVAGSTLRLPGPTGEQNELRLTGRGVFVCISPWNFPLAIFTGQIAAALAAGNTVIAKPAEQGTLVGAYAVDLLERAGIPVRALHFVPGDGRTIGGALLGDPRVAGVAFTGSVETAAAINRRLAQRVGPLATLIAETGGVNAMIVDSSALPEQVVRDAVQSAFNSAGQRCSALRMLCLQEDTADEVLRLLLGHLGELVIGDPALLSTDVGPVIDAGARAKLAEYVAGRGARVLYQSELGEPHAHGLFFPPTVIGIDSPTDLREEIFGPVLHVLRYGAGRATELVAAINELGYGLTLGVHTRIDAFASRIARDARVGNIYVNRNMIGAQVGVQPFGGMGLSGTGPKAGGPHYLPRFAAEQTVTINTAAVGGNATLLSLESDADPL